MSAQLVLYGKRGCHLCEQAEALLTALRADLDFEITAVDIASDPVLYDRYRETIPVVTLNGTVLLAAPIGPMMARSVLAARIPRRSEETP